MFDTLTFWATLLTLGAFAVFFAGQRAVLLPAAIVLVSAGLLHFVAGLPWWALGLLVLTGGWTAWGAARREAPALIFLPVVVVWVAGKVGVGWAVPSLSLFAFVGFSFVLMKVWTLLKDAQAGQITDVDPVLVLAYLLHFPTYVAGPIHYYGEFRAVVARPRFPDAAELVDVGFRILVGLTKTKVLVPLLLPASLAAVPLAETVTLAGLVGASLVYFVVIYLDFSGYSDIAIGATRLLGLTAPENFNRPYLAPNLREFWQRWHISFSRALTNYVFVPVSRALTARWGQHRTLVMVTSYTATFAFCGFWHGSTLNALLWGLYHAAGLIVYDLYKPWATKRRFQRKGQPLPPWRVWPGRVAASAGTFLFVAVGWIPFVLPTEVLRRLLIQFLHL